MTDGKIRRHAGHHEASYGFTMPVKKISRHSGNHEASTRTGQWTRWAVGKGAGGKILAFVLDGR